MVPSTPNFGAHAIERHLQVAIPTMPRKMVWPVSRFGLQNAAMDSARTILPRALPNFLLFGLELGL